MGSQFGDLYSGITFDIDEGYDSIIPKMLNILGQIEPARQQRLKEGYSDVFKNMKYSSEDNKEFLFQDLVLALDLSCAPGWIFGPEEEYSCIYGFWSENL